MVLYNATFLLFTDAYYRKPLPLTTVELQKAASRLLKMTPKKVLDVSFPLTPAHPPAVSLQHRSPKSCISKVSCLIHELKPINMILSLISMP